jgi:hypothetical protein
MMMVSNIFGSGEMWPKFGGARLANGQAMFQNPIVDAAVTSDRKLHECRAADPAYATFLSPSFLRAVRNSNPTAEQPFSQRLGTRFDFDQMRGPHKSWVSGKLSGRSGASPHQHLMTISKTSVTYFKHPVVSL